MNAPTSIFPFTAIAARFMILLLGASIKASLVFVHVFGATRLMRDTDPRLRHLLWFGAVSGYLLILLLSFFPPPLLPRRPSAPAAASGVFTAVSPVLLPQGGMAVSEVSGAPALAMGEAAPGGPVWGLPVLLIWIAGVLASQLKIAVGGIRLHRLIAEAKTRSHPRDLAEARGDIDERVRVLESPACRVPFAGGLLRPFIMLPASARAWPTQRLRAVLLHEYCHIRRRDPLTQALGRWICSLFWFVPLAWIAYSFQYAEQEKCCDASVLEHGVAPGSYATCLLQTAQQCHESAAFAGLYFPRWRKSVLVERIRNIVEGGLAKKRWLVFAPTLFGVCFLVMLGGADARKPLSEEEAYQRFVGTWVNEVYPGDIYLPEMRVIRADYKVEDWVYTWSKEASWVWEIKVKKTWSDFRGNTYCHFSWKYIEGYKPSDYSLARWRSGVGVMRVDGAGKVWESNLRWSADHRFYPEKIDIERRRYSDRYFIYQRQKGTVAF